jgi:hypothetical protein
MPEGILAGRSDLLQLRVTLPCERARDGWRWDRLRILRVGRPTYVERNASGSEPGHLARHEGHVLVSPRGLDAPHDFEACRDGCADGRAP